MGPPPFLLVERIRRQDFFAVGIEADPPFLHIRNVGEMGCLRGTMPDPDIAVRTLAGTAAVEEIFDVINGLVAVGFDDGGLGAARRWRELIAASIDVEFTFRPHHFDTCTLQSWSESRFEGCCPLFWIFKQCADRVRRGPTVLIGVHAA